MGPWVLLLDFAVKALEKDVLCGFSCHRWRVVMFNFNDPSGSLGSEAPKTVNG